MLRRVANYVIDGGEVGGNLRWEPFQRLCLHCGLVYLGYFGAQFCLISYFNFGRFEHGLWLWLRLGRLLVSPGNRRDETPGLFNLMLISGISLVYLQCLSEGIIVWPQLDMDIAGLCCKLVRLGGRGVGAGRRHQIRLEVLPPVRPRRDLEDIAGTVLNRELLLLLLCWLQYFTWCP